MYGNPYYVAPPNPFQQGLQNAASLGKVLAQSQALNEQPQLFQQQLTKGNLANQLLGLQVQQEPQTFAADLQGKNLANQLLGVKIKALPAQLQAQLADTLAQQYQRTAAGNLSEANVGLTGAKTTGQILQNQFAPMNEATKLYQAAQTAAGSGRNGLNYTTLRMAESPGGKFFLQGHPQAAKEWNDTLAYNLNMMHNIATGAQQNKAVNIIMQNAAKLQAQVNQKMQELGMPITHTPQNPALNTVISAAADTDPEHIEKNAPTDPLQHVKGVNMPTTAVEMATTSNQPTQVTPTVPVNQANNFVSVVPEVQLPAGLQTTNAQLQQERNVINRSLIKETTNPQQVDQYNKAILLYNTLKNLNYDALRPYLGLMGRAKFAEDQLRAAIFGDNSIFSPSQNYYAAKQVLKQARHGIPSLMQQAFKGSIQSGAMKEYDQAMANPAMSLSDTYNVLKANAATILEDSRSRAQMLHNTVAYGPAETLEGGYPSMNIPPPVYPKTGVVGQPFATTAPATTKQQQSPTFLGYTQAEIEDAARRSGKTVAEIKAMMQRSFKNG